MRKTIIQIYEVQKPKEAEALVALGVDHIGSVLADPQKWKSAAVLRTVQAAKCAGARSGIIPIMKDPVKIFQALDYYQPDFVHFCEALSPFPGDNTAVVREFDALTSLQVDVKDRFPQIEIMRSLSLPELGLPGSGEILTNILHFVELLAPFSDYFLIDTLICGPQPVSGYVGITGLVCDWAMAKTVIDKSPIPVILAGGLSGENVFEAVVTLRPAGVDSCTQTNAVDRSGRPVRFKKDLKKVRRFVEEARRADRFLEGEGGAAL